jgi:hypothetical protein
VAKSYDLVIRGGRLVDGTGATPRTADIAIRGDTIADIGAIMPTDETPLLEASGLTVAPGFIDAWGAADPLAPLFTKAETKLLQGITTDVAGAGGHVPFPLGEGGGAGLSEEEERLVVPDWTDAKGFLTPLCDVLVRLEDRPGMLALMTGALADNGINVKDIELLKIREGEGGTIRLAFADAEDADRAIELLAGVGLSARTR